MLNNAGEVNQHCLPILILDELLISYRHFKLNIQISSISTSISLAQLGTNTLQLKKHEAKINCCSIAKVTQQMMIVCFPVRKGIFLFANPSRLANTASCLEILFLE
jgi:hypothetical protein